jgi:Spy/CpxP family protein refolding chaperone
MNFKKSVTVMAASLVVFALSFTTEAAPFGPGLRGPGIMGNLVGLRPFLELNLSETQRLEMTNIINKYRDDIKALAIKMMESRKTLTAILDAEQFNEEDVRNRFRETSAGREEMFLLIVKMVKEIRALLTPEQLELLKERKAQRIEIMDRLLELRFWEQD